MTIPPFRMPGPRRPQPPPRLPEPLQWPIPLLLEKFAEYRDQLVDEVEAKVMERVSVEAYLKPADGIPESDMDAAVRNALALARSSVQDVSGKADKAVPAAAGNLAALGSSGNLVDSGAKPADFAPASGIAKSALDPNVQASLDRADSALQEHQSLATYVNAASYDSGAKKILLKHASTTVAEIDATAFIKDGMVSSVGISGGNLVITFNTDAGLEPIEIPLADVFNPSNYYDKTAADGRFVAKEAGKGLSSNDYTDVDKARLDSVQAPVAPSTEASASGKPADAKATGDALQLSHPEIALLASAFPVTYRYAGASMTLNDSAYLKLAQQSNGSYNLSYVNPSTGSVAHGICRISSAGKYQGTVNANVSSLAFAGVAPVADETQLLQTSGARPYMLGPSGGINDGKLLASEEEIQQLTSVVAGKQDALSAQRLANIDAVPDKASAADLRYDLVTLAAGSHDLRDRAVNSVPVNSDGIWKSGDSVVPVYGRVGSEDDIPQGKLAYMLDFDVLDLLLYNLNGVVGVCSVYGEPSFSGLSAGTYYFYGYKELNGTAASPAVTFTPTTMERDSRYGTWSGTISWTDPVSGETRTSSITDASFDGSQTTDISFDNGNGYLSYAYIASDAEWAAGVSVTVDSVQVGGDDVTSSCTVSVTSVNFSYVSHYGVGTLSIPSLGVTKTGVNYGAFMENYGGSGSGTCNLAVMDYLEVVPGVYLDSSYLIEEVSGMAPVVNTTYGFDYAVLSAEYGLVKSSGMYLDPPPAVPGKVRDFVVVVDAAAATQLAVPGVKGVDDDSLSLAAGKNAVYVSEYSAGEMYAMRKLLEAAS